MSELNIYKASAGSGKTFTLTKQYIKLLFENPNDYKSILAVTFTNKATEEMKSRIIKEIYCLARGKKSGYYNDLIKIVSNDDEKLKQTAKTLLTNILHNYSWFSVTTIDSFFQKVIRAFAREVGLKTGFNIEMDQKPVLARVTERLFKKIDSDKELRKWLRNFAERNIKDGKKWNFRKSIEKLSGEIFKEDYKQFDEDITERLKDKAYLKEYRTNLKKLKDSFTASMKDYGNKALEIIHNKGLETTSFKGKKSSFANYFNKIINASKDDNYIPGVRVKEAVDNVENWYTATNKEEICAIEEVFPELNSLLKEILHFYELNFKMYKTSKLVLEHIDTLGILSDISVGVKEFTNEENIFLMSDSAHMLNSVIGNNDSPFVYEKTGIAFKHFMIDEFQDTSGMQWNNFRPLIENSLSENNYSLIVGDVKQSIYRWRSGDWDLLENQLEKDFKDLGTNVETLNYNWRSKTNVIRFNNSIFDCASAVLQKKYNDDMAAADVLEENDQIIKCYDTAYQDIPSKNKEGGAVNVNFIELGKEDKFDDIILENLPKQIIDLQDRGYQAGDIAILVRKSSEGKKVAERLMKYKNEEAASKYNFDIISNDSLFLDASSAVKLIISVIKYLLAPKESMYKASVLMEGCYTSDSHVPNDIEMEFKEKMPKELTEGADNMASMPLYELTERIIELFGLNKEPNNFPYLQAFQDVVSEYCNKNGSDISLFIDWWEEEKDKKKISVSEEQNAINIITIHKSKGLEYKVVLIPFCTWKIDPTNPPRILWSKTDDNSLGDMNIFPVNYSSGMAGTVFSNSYFEEKLKSYIDNLNLLYVAFTRAEDELIVSAPKPKRADLSTVGNLLHFVFENHSNFYNKEAKSDYADIDSYWNSEESVFLMQDGAVRPQQSISQSNKAVSISNYTSVPLNNRLKLKYHSDEYFDFVEGDNMDEFSPVSKGNLMHEAFKMIKTHKDIEFAVSSLVYSGKISLKQADGLRNDITKLINDSDASEWFADDAVIINERDIITLNHRTYRPDRVVLTGDKTVIIDYKTGKEKLKSYESQIKGYINALNDMGYKNINGYIWYLRDNTKTEVSVNK